MIKNNNKLLTLKEAVEQYKQEERSASNSYGWYRKQARKSEGVWIGGIHISAIKQKGVWYVDRKELAKAIYE